MHVNNVPLLVASYNTASVARCSGPILSPGTTWGQTAWRARDVTKGDKIPSQYMYVQGNITQGTADSTTIFGGKSLHNFLHEHINNNQQQCDSYIQCQACLWTYDE